MQREITCLNDLGFKELYFSSDPKFRTKFNKTNSPANAQFKKNDFVPEHLLPEAEEIFQRCLTERTARNTKLECKDFLLRINHTVDGDGFHRVCARYINTTIPDFYDKKWGYDPELITTILKWLQTPGYFVIFGTTGSGKTMMTAAALGAIMKTESLVIRTAEDPIEFKFPTQTDLCEVVQWEIEKDTEWNERMGDMVRNNPDVCGVGELRFPEATATFFNLGSAGPKVYATTHGKDIPAGMQRLFNIGKASTMGEAVSEAMADAFNGAIHISLVPNEKGGVTPVTTILDATLKDSTSGIRANIRSQNFAALGQEVRRQQDQREAEKKKNHSRGPKSIDDILNG